jgi:ribonucleoside-diphosphate reductase alpha chain
MSISALQEYIRISKYARYNKQENRRETWEEQVKRVTTMHREHYKDILSNVEDEINEVETAMIKKLILGSQRALQYGGISILEKNEKLYNCSASYCDRARFFQETMWLLLCGCGVGFSVQKHHIAKLPNLVKTCPDIRNENFKKMKITIEDSIEGWSDTIGQLLSSYFVGEDVPFPECQGKHIEFDYSKIRPAGSIIKSSGSKAPGPDGLRNAINKITKLLQHVIIENEQSVLRPIDAYDIVMHISDAVLSGGIRRSATLSIFSIDDDDMLNAKTGDWHITNPQRGRSNNSIMLLRNKTTYKQFKHIIEKVKSYGEPGFLWVDSLEFLFNPCSEIGLYAYDKHGNSGWGMCNLSEINVKKTKNKEQFLQQCRYGSILGTLQAGYTSFPYLGKVTEDIVKRESLLGVSLTGMMDNPDIAFNPELQREGAKLIKNINEKLSKKIGINPGARCTTLKPSGSASCLLGTSSGIHPHHSKRYFRRVQANKYEETLQHFKKINPLAVEESVWSANETDDVITFLCEVPTNSRTKVNIDGLKLLEYVKLTQSNWIQAGKNKKLCVKPWLSHNVSNTIHVRDDEWEDVTKYIYQNKNYFAGISILGIDGDKDFAQAPFTTVYTPGEIVKEYGDGSLMASGLIVDGNRIWDNDLWLACNCILGVGEDLDLPEFKSKKGENRWKRENNYNEKIDWLRRSKQFAERYFDGDMRKMTYCLKDVYNWKLWCDLKREYKDINWVEFHEQQDNTKITETIACAGGSCDIM